MPCRNEAATVGMCVDEAAAVLKRTGLNGEILVVDNASDDGSYEAASGHGARVVREESVGYGNAIRRGIKEACGDVLVIGDCDTTYDFSYAEQMYRMIASDGYDMVIGDRFGLPMEKGAMSLSHKIGVRVLSAIGRVRYKTDVRDFHCGLRAIRKDAADKIKLRTAGMEFATEMIAGAALSGLSVGQIPVTLRTCRISRRSKLRTFRDGMRHLVFMLKKT